MIHILDQGRAICGQPGVPRDWPIEHKWVGAEDAPKATCRDCVLTFKKRKTTRREK